MKDKRISEQTIPTNLFNVDLIGQEAGYHRPPDPAEFPRTLVRVDAAQIEVMRRLFDGMPRFGAPKVRGKIGKETFDKITEECDGYLAHMGHTDWTVEANDSRPTGTRWQPTLNREAYVHPLYKGKLAYAKSADDNYVQCLIWWAP